VDFRAEPVFAFGFSRLAPSMPHRPRTVRRLESRRLSCVPLRFLFHRLAGFLV